MFQQMCQACVSSSHRQPSFRALAAEEQHLAQQEGALMTIAHIAPLAPMVSKLARRATLGVPEMDALLSLPIRQVSIVAGRQFVQEGDTSSSCAVILSGFAGRSKTVRNGNRQIMSIDMRGDIVDLPNSFLGYADHSVTSLSRLEVAEIPRHAILAVAEAYPAIARAFMLDTLINGSIFREWILNVGQRDARERISHLYCEIVLRQREAGLGLGPTYNWPFSQEQIGDATGLTAVHVNRTLQTMRTGKHTLTIEDWAKLQKDGGSEKAYLHQDRMLAA
jgi:CRP-like cAMP-binding protein